MHVTAKGQVTTARDIARLSMAYLRRFPDSLTIHSMQAYTYGSSSHHNANRLLGQCPGVDGLKTGFVCASGYNITATAKRGDTRILAVVLGARTPGIRLRETRRLLEAGFAQVAPELANMNYASLPADDTDAKKPSYVKVPAGAGFAPDLQHCPVRGHVLDAVIAHVHHVPLARPGGRGHRRQSSAPVRDVDRRRRASAGRRADVQAQQPVQHSRAAERMGNDHVVQLAPALPAGDAVRRTHRPYRQPPVGRGIALPRQPALLERPVLHDAGEVPRPTRTVQGNRLELLQFQDPALENRSRVGVRARGSVPFAQLRGGGA